MKQPTKQDILECDDKDQLNEWAAIYCMGWQEALDEDSHSIDWITQEDGYICKKRDYSPCTDKAQSFDLMVKYGVYPIRAGTGSDKLFIPRLEPDSDLFHVDELQTAIVKAALIREVMPLE